MTVKWKLRGFDHYYVTKKGWVIRKEYITNNHHYKAMRFISQNNRNQFTLYRQGIKEIRSNKQLRNILVSISEITIPNYSILKTHPF